MDLASFKKLCTEHCENTTIFHKQTHNPSALTLSLHRLSPCLPSAGKWWAPELTPDKRPDRSYSLHRAESSRQVFPHGNRSLARVSRRIIEWPGLKRTIMIIEFQPPCHVQGHQPPDQAAQSHIQPGLECLHGWGIHNLLGQLVPMCHHPLGHRNRHSRQVLSDSLIAFPPFEFVLSKFSFPSPAEHRPYCNTDDCLLSLLSLPEEPSGFLVCATPCKCADNSTQTTDFASLPSLCPNVACIKEK